jgi:hypothetical protein
MTGNGLKGLTDAEMPAPSGRLRLDDIPSLLASGNALPGRGHGPPAR